MSEVERIELRAERLRVLVAAIGEEPTMNAGDTFASGIVPGGFRDYLEGLEYEHVARDLDLACELANLAREIRARQWHSLERLGALIASGKGETPTEKYGSLPRAEIVAATRAMLDLGMGVPAARRGRRRRRARRGLAVPGRRHLAREYGAPECPAGRRAIRASSSA